MRNYGGKLITKLNKINNKELSPLLMKDKLELVEMIKADELKNKEEGYEQRIDMIQEIINDYSLLADMVYKKGDF